MFTLASGSQSKASRLLREVCVSATSQHLAQSPLFQRWKWQHNPCHAEAATCESGGAHVTKLLRQEESIKASAR